jgi:hypothetical protein
VEKGDGVRAAGDADDNGIIPVQEAVLAKLQGN